jgi:hypothetical protein
MNVTLKKFGLKLMAAIVLIVALAGPAITAMAASMGLISIRVSETSDKDRRSTNSLSDRNRISRTDNNKNDDITETSESRSITIEITNRGQKAYDGAKVKYWLFARDMASRKGAVLTSGDELISLKPMGSAVVSSKSVKITSTTVRNSEGREQNGTRKLGSERTGQRYAGYGVAVIDKEGNLIAEDFTAGGMRELVARELPVDKNPWGLRK